MGTPYTIHEAIWNFLTDRQSLGRAPKTIDFYRTHLIRFADYLDDLGTRSLGDLSRQGLRGFYAYLQRREVRQNSRAAYDRAIRTFLKFCRLERYLDRDLLKGRPRIRQGRELPDTWEDEEIKALLGTCDDDGLMDVRDRAIMLVFLDTGLRAGGLTGLTIEDLSLDDDRGMVRVVAEHTKSGRGRQVPMCAETVCRLRQWLEIRGDEPGPVFVASDGHNLTNEPIGTTGLNALIRRRVKKAGIKPKRALCHIWRHTFARRYVMAGGDVETLRRLLGHASLDTTQRYLAFRVQDLADKHARFSPVHRLLGAVDAD